MRTTRYGHHPTGLIVDEVWIFVVDVEHIVTFPSNQTWKSRWPPLQLSWRIAEVSFRSIRNTFFTSEQSHQYTAMTHAIACLHGAVGMLHGSFWPDMPLPCTDRYGDYLGHLVSSVPVNRPVRRPLILDQQYRLHRAPSSKLVMDLLQVQDELNIILSITKNQQRVIQELFSHTETASFRNPVSRDPVTDSYHMLNTPEQGS